MWEEHVLKYGHVLPAGPVYEGLYIDDHFVLQKISKKEAHVKGGEDERIIQATHQAYRDSGVVRAPEKAFGCAATPSKENPAPVGAQTFTVIGTEVRAEPGLVGAPLQKRLAMMLLLSGLATAPGISQNLLRRALGLLMHPLVHRRELMCVFQGIHTWMNKIPEKRFAKWHPLMLEEFVAAIFLLPLAQSHIRWPVSARIGATDATVTRGGTVEGEVSAKFAEDLFRFVEPKGAYIRLDGNPDKRHDLLPAFNDIEEFCQSVPWRVVRSKPFTSHRHINIQELRELLRDLRYLSITTFSPGRFLDGGDSNVVLGCWTKGRSPSLEINSLLRVGGALCVFSRKQLFGFRLGTKANVADDPSREAPLREPTVPKPWMREHLETKAGTPLLNDPRAGEHLNSWGLNTQEARAHPLRSVGHCSLERIRSS